MSGRNASAYIMGAYEHPLRIAPDKTVAQLHAEVARGALADAGLSKDDVEDTFALATLQAWAACPWSTTWASSRGTWTPQRPAVPPT
jgi:3-oxoacyl-[acyl-carrier-protein] synthase III